jgi:hypothetical protein
MRGIINWVRDKGGWVRSPYGDLPRLRVDDTPVHQTWLIFAGGLALILSRASRSELEARFAAARRVHAIAHARLRKRRLPRPDPLLLRDALKEIANLADPMTREAGRECLARTVDRSAQGRSTGATTTGTTPSSQATSHVTSQAGAPAAAVAPPTVQYEPTEQHEATQLDLDLLFERSNKLRDAVAWARSTTFGQDGPEN